MEQKKNQQTKDSQDKIHSDNLIRQMMSQPYDLAVLWGRAADSFPQNKRPRLHRCQSRLPHTNNKKTLLFEERSFLELIFP